MTETDFLTLRKVSEVVAKKGRSGEAFFTWNTEFGLCFESSEDSSAVVRIRERAMSARTTTEAGKTESNEERKGDDEE
jgi:hypothetical protein